MKKRRVESREQIVFEPEFDELTHGRVDIFVNVRPDEDGMYSVKISHKDSYDVRPLKAKFGVRDDAFDYGKDVLARYKRKIAVAELEFILSDEKLDADFLNVIKNADVPKEDGVG